MARRRRELTLSRGRFAVDRTVPTDQIIEQGGRSGIAEALTAGTTGFQTGFNFSNAIRSLRNRQFAAKTLAQNKGLFGLEGEVPPEFFEAAIENPSVLTALINRSADATNQSIFGVDEEGNVVLKNPDAVLNAPQAQVLLRQKSIGSSEARARQAFELGLMRLANAKSDRESKNAQFLLNLSVNPLAGALQPSILSGVESIAPGASGTVTGDSGLSPEDTDFAASISNADTAIRNIINRKGKLPEAEKEAFRQRLMEAFPSRAALIERFISKF